jgi:hypothetical protein
VKLLPARSTGAASVLFACACSEAAQLSFAVGAEHLLLACAIFGALDESDVTPDEVREAIVADERAALASLGISLDSVRSELAERFGDELLSDGCGLPVTPEAKRVLELASRRRRLVTADQLLATLREHSPTAQRLLRTL